MSATLQENLNDSPHPAPEDIPFRQIVALLVRSWPYYRPQLRHLIMLFLITVGSGLGLALGGVVGLDILNNGILVGEPVTRVQAAFLLLDDSYVTTGVDGELLGEVQRQVLRNHFMVVMAIAYMALLIIYAGGYWYMRWILARINQELRIEMLARAQHLSLRYHGDAKTGDAIYRVYQDSATITNVFQILVASPLRAVLYLLGAILLLVAFSPLLGLICVITAIPVTYLFFVLTPSIRRWSRRARETNSNLTSRVQEVFTGIKVIKSNRAEQRVLDRFNADSTEALDAAYHLRFRIALLKVGITLCVMMALLVMEYLMANWTIAGKATFLGGTVTFVGFLVWNLGAFQSAAAQGMLLNSSIGDFAHYWGIGQDLVVGLKRAFFLLDLEPEVQEVEHPKAFPSPIRSVTWTHVDFSYDASKQRVLQDVNLHAATGTITAIVGSTGTGKSTLVSLLLRLYDPDGGQVTINDVDIRELKIRDLRNNVSIALQKNVLFAKSVANNIAYVDPKATRAAVEAAARVACAHDFIQEMPEGYDTELGERGGKLSSGQRQRLSIARAILRNTPILILDEPTASLDAQTEHEVLKNLHEWGRDRVVLLITHRLSTIRNADQIAFMKDGRVCELGSHDELMQLENGHYRGFVEAELYSDREAAVVPV